MDKKAREIIGLPVVSLSRGAKIFEVEDMIIDPERRQVLALVVSEGSFFHSAQAIPFGRINVIGQDAVVIPDGRAVIEVNRDQVLKRLHNDHIVRGMRVLTDDGRKLGEVADMLLDSQTGEIKGYYVSVGRVLSVTQGARWLPSDRVTSMGQRVLFVPADYGQEFDEQSGGIVSALDQAGERLRTAGGKANTHLETFGGRVKVAGGRFNEQLGQFGDQTLQTLPQRAGSMIMGKIAQSRVADREGNIIVQTGDVITQESYDTARNTGRLPQLFLAAGSGPAQQHLGPLGDQASQSLRDIPNEARQLWAQLTGGYNKRLDHTDNQMLERRVKQTLGRPVTRVILDRDDNIILNTGDIVTNRAIEAARQADMLDILADSVYTERPKLGLEDLKAPRSGDMSLERIAADSPAGNGKSAPLPETSQAAVKTPPA